MRLLAAARADHAVALVVNFVNFATPRHDRASQGPARSTGADHAVIDVGGVGYLVGAPARTLAALGAVGEAATLHTEMLVAEDFIRLVGFARADERDWFRLLTGVQGVGARVALAILSALEPDDLSRAVAAQDKATVARANGVGPKLAERIVRELKDKVGGVALGPGRGRAGAARRAPAPTRSPRSSTSASAPPRRPARSPRRRRNWAPARRSTRWSGWRSGRRRSSALAARALRRSTVVTRPFACSSLGADFSRGNTREVRGTSARRKMSSWLCRRPARPARSQCR